MGRHKSYRVSRDRGGFPYKRDTPVKRALSRQNECRRLLPNKHYEAFPEEPEVEEISVPTVKPAHLKSIKPVHCKSALQLSSLAFTENPRHKVISHAAPSNKKSGYRASPAGHPTARMTLEPDAFKGGEMPVKEKEQNLTVTLGNITPSSMELDTTVSSDDDDDGDDDEEDSSASATSSNPPSPEIFRRESYVETLTFSLKEEMLGLHPHIKNSTLLDVSHAESIHTYQPPNLSYIDPYIDASTIHTEKNCEINKNSGPETETKIHTDLFKSEKAFKGKTPPKLTNRRPILYKKKVWFKSPIVAETFEAKHTPASKLTSSLAEQLQPDADASRADEINSKDEALRLTVTLKRPVKSSPEKAKFFDFIDDSERIAFFKGMRKRCVELRSAPLFPLTAPKYTESSVL